MTHTLPPTQMLNFTWRREACSQRIQWPVLKLLATFENKLRKCQARRVERTSMPARQALNNIKVVETIHQITQRRSTGRTRASPDLQLNAFWNSGRLESGLMTRYLLTGCGLVSTNWRCVSGR